MKEYASDKVHGFILRILDQLRVVDGATEAMVESLMTSIRYNGGWKDDESFFRAMTENATQAISIVVERAREHRSHSQ